MGEIYVISGWSGVGKSSLCKAVLKTVENAELVRSYTTRKPRGECDDYIFVSPNTFEQMQRDGAFLESNFYNGNHYGTPKKEVERILQQGRTALLEIDINGYKKILSSEISERENIHGIFIVATADDIFKRLLDRKTESLGEILGRMETAISEAEELKYYDTLLWNKDFEVASKQLALILSGETTQEAGQFDVESFIKDSEEILEKYKLPV